LPYDQTDSEPVLFLSQDKTYLRVNLTISDESGVTVTSSSSPPPPSSNVPNDLLREAQRSFIEQEIFQLLIRDAGHLSYASCRVSDKVVILEAAPGVELRCELVSSPLTSYYFALLTGHQGRPSLRCFWSPRRSRPREMRPHLPPLFRSCHTDPHLEQGATARRPAAA
jgi:hypothetical protein